MLNHGLPVQLPWVSWVLYHVHLEGITFLVITLWFFALVLAMGLLTVLLYMPWINSKFVWGRFLKWHYRCLCFVGICFCLHINVVDSSACICNKINQKLTPSCLLLHRVLSKRELASFRQPEVKMCWLCKRFCFLLGTQSFGGFWLDCIVFLRQTSTL